MNRERVYRLQALVLKRMDFGEADRLLTIYTPSRGKLRVVAKGARKPQSRKSGHVELFTLVHLQLARARNIDLVTQAEIIDPFLALRADLERTAHAYYAAELVDQFSEEDQENPPVFDLLRAAFGRIGDSPDLWLSQRYFEMHLLSYFGYQPQLHYCVAGDEPIEPVDNFFDTAQGGVLCPRHGEGVHEARPLSLNALKALRYLQSREYDDAMRVQLSAATRGEVEGILQRYITHVLERRVKSGDFLRVLERAN